MHNIESNIMRLIRTLTMTADKQANITGCDRIALANLQGAQC